jgi:hypothetical protein
MFAAINHAKALTKSSRTWSNTSSKSIGAKVSKNPLDDVMDPYSLF